MTKLLTTIVLLLHLCVSVQANWDIHLEMMNGLKSLDLLYRQNKSNISFPTAMSVPSPQMLGNASKCVGVFVTELNGILSNVTVRNDDRDTLAGIQKLLQRMEGRQAAAGGQQDGQACLMKPWTHSLMPFKQFIRFLMKLSNKRR